jgi:hypothetical protein
MKTIKTYIMFENGKILESGKYDSEFSARATAIERAKFFMIHYVRENKLSGQITIEAQNDRLNFGCDVNPKKHLKPLVSLLNKNHGIIKSL